MKPARDLLGSPVSASRSPAGWALWLVGVPFALHLATAVMFGMEADTSVEVLIAVMFAGAATGGIAAKVRVNLLLGAAAAAWPPALMAWRRWYWAMDMHSPGGAAQGLLAYFSGWRDAPAPLAVAAAAAASSLPGWLVIRVDRWHERRTGRSFFDDD